MAAAARLAVSATLVATEQDDTLAANGSDGAGIEASVTAVEHPDTLEATANIGLPLDALLRAAAPKWVRPKRKVANLFATERGDTCHSTATIGFNTSLMDAGLVETASLQWAA